MDKVIHYDLKRFNFHQNIQQIFGVDNLLSLHEIQYKDGVIPNYNFEAGKDQATWFHEKFYSGIESSNFLSLYRKFIREFISIQVNGSRKLLYQKIPTFRVQLPNNKSVGGKSHRDVDYNHPAGEINFLLPMTPMRGSNAVFYESEPGLKDFKFKDLDPGMCWIFNGNQCEHGNIANLSGWTRVSLDFRIISEDDLKKSMKLSSVAHKIKFAEGHYYEAL